jgi:hypothetical protein
VSPPGSGGKIGTLLEPVSGKFPDRLQHPDARLASRQIDLADQALLEQPGEAVEQVSNNTILRLSLARHGLDRGNIGRGKHREHFEQALFIRLQQVVAPVHGGP